MFHDGWGVKKDDKQAAYWFRKAAEQGDAHAQCTLGVKYICGTGVPVDEEEAVSWLRLAANQSDVEAQLILGDHYSLGVFVTENYTESMKWYRMAAEQGNTIAQNCLGEMYESGKRVPRDSEEAEKWHRLAAEQNAAQAVAQAYFGRDDFPRDYNDAMRRLRKAAGSDAQLSFGFMSKKNRVSPVALLSVSYRLSGAI